MSNPDFDKPGSAFPDDSYRYGASASDEVSPPKPEASSVERDSQSPYAPRSDAVFRPRLHPKTVAEKPRTNETQILQTPDYDALNANTLDANTLDHQALIHSATKNGAAISTTGFGEYETGQNTQDEHGKNATKSQFLTPQVVSPPARRETDLNGAPETILPPRANSVDASNEDSKNEDSKNEYSKNEYSNGALSPRVSSAPTSPHDSTTNTPSSAFADGVNKRSPGRIEYFLEHILLRHFIQPPTLQTGQWREEQREDAYNLQTLDLFRLRLRLVTGLAMIMLLFHTLLYIYLTPDDARLHSVIYGILIVVCISTRHIANKLSSVESLRQLSLWCYLLFSLGGALIVGIVGRGQMFILGGHNHILLTTLLLPFAAADCLLIGSIVVSSLAVSGYFTFIPYQRELYLSQLFTLCTTMAFTVFVAYFQSALRRRAFDSAFDAMCSMSRYQNMSLRDTLTGGHNRRYLMQTLETEIARATRFARPISLILFDLDNFKSVNDTLGHAAGDQVLTEVWHAATKAVRNVDTPARYGGDEFAVVLPEAAEEAAHVIASRLRTTACAHLAHSFGADSLQAKVTLSIGIVTLRPHDFVSVEQLLFMADTQLYAAKKAGKNRIAN